MTPLQVLFSVIGISLIIIAAYYVTYFYARKANGIQSGRNMRVVDRLPISKDKAIFLIEANGKRYLVGMTSGGVALLDSYEGETDAEAADEGSRVLGAFKSDMTAGKLGSRLLEPLTGLLKKTGSAPAKDETDDRVKIAGEEDGLDEVYRKLRTRRRNGSDGENPFEEGDE
ncbi:MAG: flagellar biosynthetic protein FliO [Oscillospiraceae bacterium]|jgi:flagellar protein FliO/FliZ|nr:flagellar biosynthetic protein FliO [Oscillospiraceae bacterium]